jgi:hypothetical protein
MRYDHKVHIIFDPCDATGFVYTAGMHPKFELFALGVPYGLADEVCRIMNFLSQRTVRPNQTAQSGHLIYYLRPVCAPQGYREELMETRLTQMRPDAKILQLCLIGGWPEAKEKAPADHILRCTCHVGDNDVRGLHMPSQG